MKEDEFNKVILAIEQASDSLDLHNIPLGTMTHKQLDIFCTKLLMKANQILILNLSGCQIESLGQCADKVKYSGVFMSDTESFAMIEKFFNAISRLIYLRELDISNNELYTLWRTRSIDGVTNGYKIISDTLKQLITVEKLNVSSINLGATSLDVTRFVFESIPAMVKLKHLLLSNCMIGDGKRHIYHGHFATTMPPTPNIQMIFDNIQKLNHLESLDLSQNDLLQFTNQDWELLILTLPMLTNLKEINLADNNIAWFSTELFAQLQKMLKLLHAKNVKILFETNDNKKCVFVENNILTMNITELLSKLKICLNYQQLGVPFVIEHITLKRIIQRFSQFMKEVDKLYRLSENENKPRLILPEQIISIYMLLANALINSEKAEFDTCFQLYQLIVNEGNLEKAKDILLLIPVESKDFAQARLCIFRDIYLSLRNADNDAKSSFLEAVQYCYVNNQLVNVSEEFSDIFDAALTQAVGKLFPPGQKIDQATRIHRIKAILNPEKDEKTTAKNDNDAVNPELEEGKYKKSSDTITDVRTRSLPYPDVVFQNSAQQVELLRKEREKIYFVKKIEELRTFSFANLKVIAVSNDTDFAQKSNEEVEIYTAAQNEIERLRAHFNEIITACASGINLTSVGKLNAQMAEISADIKDYLDTISDNYVKRNHKNTRINNNITVLNGLLHTVITELCDIHDLNNEQFAKLRK